MDLVFFDQTLFEITYRQYSLALLAVLVALGGKRLIAWLLTRLLAPLTRRTATELDDLLLECTRKPLELLVLIIGLVVAVQILQLPSEPTDIRGGAYALIRVLITIAGGWALFNMAGVFGKYLEELSARTENDLDDHLVPFVRKSLRVFIVIVVGIMVMQNLGYSTSGLLASLGIGGMALAFASKDALANIFGSLMIIFDRPFKIGDQVIAGNMEGIVEEVGFRSTKIRTPAKTLISVPNSIIANMPLDNVSRMPRRCIKLTIGLTYTTTSGQLREAVSRLRAMLLAHPQIDPETVQVNFTNFGASSLDIAVTCFTIPTALGEHLDTREDICLQIMDTVEGLGLQFAFPSRTVYLHSVAEEPTPQPAAAG